MDLRVAAVQFAPGSENAPYGRIYLITNTVNGKVYVGQTTRSIQRRFADHQRTAFRPHRKEYNSPLYRAIRKYGPEAFHVEELEQCLDLSALNFAEQRHIEQRRSMLSEVGYNARSGGRQGGVCSPKTRAKISASVKTFMQSPEARRRSSEGARKQWANPQFRSSRSEQTQQRFADPANREHLSRLGKHHMKKHPEARTVLRDYNQSIEGRKAKSDSRKRYHAEHPSDRTRLILASVTPMGVLSADIARQYSHPNAWVTSGLLHCRDLGVIFSRPLAKGERPEIQGRARSSAKVWFSCV